MKSAKGGGTYMKKNGFKKFSVFAAATIMIASLLSCHPDGPQDFTDYYTNPGKYEKPDDDDYASSQNWSYPTAEPMRLWSGSGTEAEPYIIKTVQELANLSYMVNNGESYSKKYFRLDSDIDLHRKPWTPIGKGRYSFSGKFDGNHHSVNGLYIDSNEYEYAGLFGYVYNGTIKNVLLKSGEIYSSAKSSFSGAIAGYFSYSEMISCGNDATIVSGSNADSKVGGLVGYCNNSEIYNLYCRSTVSGFASYKSGGAGGIAGDTSSGTMYNCYFSGEVEAYVANAIANKLSTYGNSNVDFCYYYENCGATDNVWGTGQISFSSPYLKISTMPDDKGAALLSRLNLWVQAQKNAEDFSQWKTDSSSGYPTLSTSMGVSAEYAWEYPSATPTPTWRGSGTKSNPIKITSAQELADFAYLVNNGSSYEGKYISLEKDITLNPETLYFRSWKPVGNGNYNFKGNFDGNDHTINGLYINSTDYSYYGGLFGYISNGSVSNVTMGYGYVSNTSSSSSTCLGAVAGYVRNGTEISNCDNKGTKVHSEKGYCGGLVGEMTASAISNALNWADVSSTNGTAGGIVGKTDNGSERESCNNYGSVSGATSGDIAGNK